MIALPGKVEVRCGATTVHNDGVIAWVNTHWVHVRCVQCHRPLRSRDIASGFSVCDNCPVEKFSTGMTS